MTFFEQQSESRGRTRLLIFLFILAVLGILLAVNGSVLLALTFVKSRGVFGEIFTFTAVRLALLKSVSLFTLLTIIAGTVYQRYQLQGGGAHIALMMGAKPLYVTQIPSEQQLLNVVQEIAIASGTVVPSIFILEDKGINAFAAGFSADSSSIVVTRGCLTELNREELQGVIAHEFSHICNGDMGLNMQLVSWLGGIILVSITGKMFFRNIFRMKGINLMTILPVTIFSLLLMGAGALGVFFARMIKSAVGREREFLADACAVQFTRNPQGLIGALKKIAKKSDGSLLSSPYSETVSHMFFAEGVKTLFNTHPPLSERIKKIDPAADEVVMALRALPSNETKKSPITVTPPAALGFTPALGTIGKPENGHLRYAEFLTAAIPPLVTSRLSDPNSAKSVIYALLLDNDFKIRAAQTEQIRKEENEPRLVETKELFLTAALLGVEFRLPLIDMATPVLRHLTLADKQAFLRVVGLLVRADEAVSLFEYATESLLSRALLPRNPNYWKTQAQTVGEIVLECQVLLSALSHAGNTKPEVTLASYTAAWSQLGAGALPLLPRGEKTETIGPVLKTLCQTSTAVKQKLIAACVACVLGDGTVTPQEAELLRVVCSMLECPMPPLLSAAPRLSQARAS